MTRFLSRTGIGLVCQLLVVMYMVHLLNILSSGRIMVFGIQPRDSSSLLFIFTAPFVHGSWLHLINNTIGFFIFSMLCLAKGKRFYIQASLLIVAVGGLMVWLIGRPAIHIGASGWIFGLWSLSIALAWFERSVMNFAIAVVVIVFYGGMIMGVLPSNPNVSFEGHACGAFAGVLAAAVLGRRHRRWRWR